jgi:branched-chain amino acid transport system ATP-binding protein
VTASAPDRADIVLEARDLTKSFAGITAVDHVALQIRRGTIHALIGPNGAGKTTCFNLLTKFLQPTEGRIYYKGADVTEVGSADLARRGLVRSFQISSIFPHLSVLDNVRVAAQRKRGNSFDFWRSMRALDALDAQCYALLDTMGLAQAADTLAVDLAYGHKRALEMATTLALDPEVLLLDEPTAGMGHEDVDRVIGLIRKVSHNRTILLVEHNLSVVSTLCNTITVMVRGKVIAEGDYATVSKDETVIASYLGSDDADE